MPVNRGVVRYMLVAHPQPSGSMWRVRVQTCNGADHGFLSQLCRRQGGVLGGIRGEEKQKNKKTKFWKAALWYDSSCIVCVYMCKWEALSIVSSLVAHTRRLRQCQIFTCSDSSENVPFLRGGEKLAKYHFIGALAATVLSKKTAIWISSNKVFVFLSRWSFSLGKQLHKCLKWAQLVMLDKIWLHQKLVPGNSKPNALCKLK